MVISNTYKAAELGRQQNNQLQLDVLTTSQADFSSLLGPIEKQMIELEYCLAELFTGYSQSSKEILEFTLNSKGKRLRAALFLYCSNLVGYEGEHLLPMAAVAEMIHNASLIHDDIVDDSKLRRQKPSAHTKWGTASAVLVGDLILSIASETMAKTGNMQIVSGYSKVIRQMSEGELLQLDYLFDPDLSQKIYFTIVEYKTAALIAMACKSAGLLAGLSESVCLNLFKFGYNLGMAFQVTDDALDYRASEMMLGKKTLVDLKSGKVTLPLLLLREYMNEVERHDFVNVCSSKEISQDQLELVVGLTVKYNTLEQSLFVADQYTNLAKESLSCFNNHQLYPNLISLLDVLLKRDY